MPTWPSELPLYPNRGTDTYEETPPDTLIRDKNDRGPDNVRRSAVAGVRKLSQPWRFTAAQVDIFDAWVRNDLEGGALSFTRPWPPPPRATATVTMRIVTIPTYKHRGAGVCDFDLQVEILP